MTRQLHCCRQARLSLTACSGRSIFWHRATAYQQLQEWDRTAADLRTAENTFTAAIAAAGSDATLAEHFRELRQRVRRQHADVLEHQGKHSEAQRLLATQ